jgi:hypothetical protein
MTERGGPQIIDAVRSQEALHYAVACLGPFPWAELRAPRHMLHRGNLVLQLLSEAAAVKRCERLVVDYTARLNAERISLRHKQLFRGMEDLANNASRLARMLQELHPDQLEFIAGALRPEPPPPGAVLVSEQELKLWFYEGRIEWGGYARVQRIQPLQNELTALSREITETVRKAKADFRFSEDSDKGGKVTVYQRFKAPSSWWLVHRGWMLFASAGHLKPSATTDGPLHRFLGSIHEAATGEDVSSTNKFKSTLTAFAKIIRKQEESFSGLEAIARRRSVPTGSFDANWSEEYIKRHFGDQKERSEVQNLQDTIHRLRLEIQFSLPVVERALRLQQTKRT